MFRGFFSKNKKKSGAHLPSTTSENTIDSRLQENVDHIRNIMNDSADLVTRTFTVHDTEHACAVVYIEGISDKRLINNHIIKNIQLKMDQTDRSPTLKTLLQTLYQGTISVGDVEQTESLDEVGLAILSGNTVLFLDGIDKALVIGSKGWQGRGVQEPDTEALVRGPRDGFSENIGMNTARIRRRLRDPNLTFESHRTGRRSKKRIVVAYIQGIAHPELIAEVKRRLATIDIDDVPETGIIEEWIEDAFLSPFPQMQPTERPDKVSTALVQGKIAIMLDNTPFSLILPVTFGNFLQSPSDYYQRWFIGTLVRVLRYVAAFIAVFLPGIYIALVSFHPGMIPSKLAFSIAATREGVPFPAFIEALLMETTMELLREAGVRLPKPIGQTIGVVGGLVLGQAAIQAGIVSPIMVIIVALGALSSYSLPSYSLAITFRILRFAVMVATAFVGLYGLIIAYIFINIHIANLKSFGVPYSTPFAPSFLKDWKDLVLRAPVTTLGSRPQFMQTVDSQRIGKGRNQ